jgi:3-hydroxybutyryl-CoA dehydrogenase
MSGGPFGTRWSAEGNELANASTHPASAHIPMVDVVNPALSEVGVVGGGTMGAGICRSLLSAGARVTLVERDADSADASRNRVAEGLRRAGDRGKLVDRPYELMTRLASGADFGKLTTAQLIIEAVPEALALKKTIIRQIEAACTQDAIIASNTSSLSLTELGTEMRHRERLIGAHFFNPVPASSLIEIVTSEYTSARALDVIRELAGLVGKTSIEVRDSPGFATSRLGVLLGLEAIRMLESGVASAQHIDQGMTLGYKHPIGPLKLTDLVGLDVRLAIAEDLSRRLGPRYEPPDLLCSMVASGLLGKKSGRGFYEWQT